MGNDGVNGKFAPSGSSSYSIWLYKGGVHCYHQWNRLIYKANGDKSTEAKAQSDGAVLPNESPLVGTPTRKMPNQGSLQP